MLRILILFLVLSSTAFAADAPHSVQAWQQHASPAVETYPLPDLRKYLTDPDSLSDFPPSAKNEIDSFYAQRGYRPAWNLVDSEAIKKTVAFLDSIDALITYHGLAPAEYHTADMRKLAADKDSDKQRLELLVTASLLRLTHDLRGETLDLDMLYTGWTFHRAPANSVALLASAINAGKLSEFFDALSPRNQSYSDLAKALQDYRALQAKGGWPMIDGGGTLRPHDNNPRVIQLRARLMAEGYIQPSPNDQSDFFDDTLSQNLTTYQRRNGLQQDGQLGSKTLDALNVPVATRIEQIRANMERWRHMPENYPPERYVQVNIPDFTVTITEEDKEIYRGNVVVGRTDRPTPFINSKITNMLINPSWHVPLKIARKDILPKLRKDPHYLETLGIVIVGREDDPTGATIDWKHMKPTSFNYQLRQEPSDINSLGQLKFNFANPFDVYMHGTPHQDLFAKAERTFSSGCVRLEEPTEVGETLLSHNKDDKGLWDEQRIENEIDSGKTHFVLLAKPIPIYFVYWSAFTDQDGQINFRKDIYGYDQTLADWFKD